MSNRNLGRSFRKFTNPETFQQCYINHLTNAANSMFSRTDITLAARSHTWQQLMNCIERESQYPEPHAGSSSCLIDIYATQYGASMAKAFFYRELYPGMCDFGENATENYELWIGKISSMLKAIDDTASNPRGFRPSLNPETGDPFYHIIEQPQSLREFFINDLIRSSLGDDYGIDLEINSDLSLDKMVDEYGYLSVELDDLTRFNLGAVLYLLGEHEKTSGDLSLIRKNEQEFESTYNRYSPDKGLKSLLRLLDRLIDTSSGFEYVRKYGVTDLHKAKVRSSLKRAVNAYYGFQIQHHPTKHKEHLIGINPATGMEYFSAYQNPTTVHEHFINNILREESELTHTKIREFDKDRREEIRAERLIISNYLCALAENEKEKYRLSLLRGYLGKINDAVQNYPLDQAQNIVARLMQKALSSYRRINGSSIEDQFTTIVNEAMYEAVAAVARNKHSQPSARKPIRLRIVTS